MTRFEVSTRKHKKYAAVLPDGTRVHFGDTRYQHFRDRTPLRAFAHLDHGDEERRRRFHARHGEYPKHSAGWFAKKYLW